ncbi:hypothetical protein AURDEDRAFT_184209 [Auricularia subglabra TFB-10046 SS5]|nr:hypothetical protein AURDEDRAFT_184209 [Auricularia subglabra TFB-10046 SS5]
MAHPMVRSLSSRSIPHSDRSSRLSRLSERGDEQPWTLFEQVMQSEVVRKPSRASLSVSLSVPARLSASSSAATDITEEPEALPPRPPPPPHQDPAPPTGSGPSYLAFPTLSAFQRNVLKCAIAYFIGSLFTFVPLLARLVGGKDGPSLQGHLVATVCVYFNPAKTVGAMMEADFFCLAGLIFAAFVCLGSMTTFWPLELSPGWEWLADVLVLSWIAGAFVFISWSKVWMEKPTYNTACSMISIIIFIVVVKEGGLGVLLQIVFHVALGASISNVICLLLWPQSATAQLQGNITKTLDSFATILNILTDSFLLREGSGPRAHLSRAVEAHQASFTTLKKNLAEAKTEWLADSRMRDAAPMYDDAVDSLNRLAQHLGGLRSGITQQSELTRSAEEHGEEAAKELADDFAELVDDLDGPLTALSAACIQALKQMEGAFHRRPEASGSTAAEFEEATQLLDRALFTFDSTSNQAILRIYRRSTMAAEHDVPETTPAEESLFLVYWFVFTFQEFAREIVTLGYVMRRVRALEELLAQQSGLPLLRWLRSPEFGLPTIGMIGRPGIRRRISMHTAHLAPNNPRSDTIFPRVKPHAPNTAQTPPKDSLSFWDRVKRTIWNVTSRVREPDMRYAFKTGLALALLATPAFYDPTRPFFVEYKGEWALISFFVVMNPTIGGTNFLSVHRVLGTLIGGATAAAIYSLFATQPVVLAIFGFLWALPCFYVIVGMPKYATSGRFVLLTYNLTCLFCYNMREEGITAPSIALQRSAAVIAGVLWAAFVSRFWWPTEARRELTKKLSEFCLEIGWLYTRLVASYSASEDAIANAGHRPRLAVNDSRRSLLPLTHDGHVELNHSIGDFMAMELYLQIKLIKMQVLLNQAQNEPRLKGPFPVALYRSILTSLQKILDKLHSMRCVTLREEWFTSVRNEFIIPVNKERKEMVGNVILYFSTLSSAFRTKAPLPPYLPAAEPARQQLVAKMRELPVVRNREVKGSRQLLYFAYALTMQGVTHELEYLGYKLQDAFGVIGHTKQEFDALFIP